MVSRKLVDSAATLALMVLFAGSALGYGRHPAPQNPAAKGEPITRAESVKGTITDITPKWLRISGGPGDGWMGVPGRNANIRILGTAQVEYLHMGQFVRFNALYDKKNNKVKDEVNKLMIFTPSSEFTPGGTPDVDVTGAAAIGDFKAMILSGQITAVKGNKLTVNVPNTNPKIKVDLAESVAIDVNLADFQIVSKGDSIEVTNGQKFQMQGGIQIVEAKITLAQPLTGAKKKGKDKPDSAAKKDAPAKKDPAPKKDT